MIRHYAQMKEKCDLNFVRIYLDILEDIPFFYPSIVTWSQSSNLYIKNSCFYRRNNAMNMLGKNRGFDLNVISK